LMSGGLDSALAAKVLMEQGVEVVALCFSSPFFGCDDARKVSASLGIELLEIDFTERILEILRSPKHGFGRNLNPCIDCHSAMISEALGIMEENQAGFVATGEVLGERPMSQNRRSLDIVAAASGRPELVLRPLSARLLEPTLPELKGWVDRDKLLGIRGRSRKTQLELAESWRLEWYKSPAGGCLLTDPGYATRLGRLMREMPGFDREDVRLLGLGRHFWVEDCLVVIGRNRRENGELAAAALPTDILLKERSNPGPLALVRTRPRGSAPSSQAMEEAAKLLGRYGKEKRPLAPEELMRWDPRQGEP